MWENNKDSKENRTPNLRVKRKQKGNDKKGRGSREEKRGKREERHKLKSRRQKPSVRRKRGKRTQTIERKYLEEVKRREKEREETHTKKQKTRRQKMRASARRQKIQSWLVYKLPFGACEPTSRYSFPFSAVRTATKFSLSTLKDRETGWEIIKK